MSKIRLICEFTLKERKVQNSKNCWDWNQSAWWLRSLMCKVVRHNILFTSS